MVKLATSAFNLCAATRRIRRGRDQHPAPDVLFACTQPSLAAAPLAGRTSRGERSRLVTSSKAAACRSSSTVMFWRKRLIGERRDKARPVPQTRVGRNRREAPTQLQMQRNVCEPWHIKQANAAREPACCCVTPRSLAKARALACDTARPPRPSRGSARLAAYLAHVGLVIRISDSFALGTWAHVFRGSGVIYLAFAPENSRRHGCSTRTACIRER